MLESVEAAPETAPAAGGGSSASTIPGAKCELARSFGSQRSISSRPALLQDTALKDAGLDKSTPETLTTACQAASWLVRSCKCGWRIDSIGPLTFLGAEAKNWPEPSVPTAHTWIYRPTAATAV